MFTSNFLVGQTENKWEAENALQEASDETDPLTIMLQEEELVVAEEGTLDEVIAYMDS